VKRALLLALLLAACKKEEAKPTPEPKAAPEPAPAAAPDAPVPAGAAASKIAPEVTPDKVETGRATIGELKKTLLGTLQQELAKGAPGAVEACAKVAPTLTEGRPFGRMTRRPRNPKNAVAGWQEEALTHFESLVAAGASLDGAVFARKLDSGKIGYAEPLVIQELCLTCHGEAIAPEVAAVLAAKYPEDRATGYRVGDLRGLAWAELD
jgi:hypothetical protein